MKTISSGKIPVNSPFLSPIDVYLGNEGKFRKTIPRNASLFRIFSEEIMLNQVSYPKVRQQMFDFIKKDKVFFQEFAGEDLEDFLQKENLDSEESIFELQALGALFEYDIYLYTQIEKPPKHIVKCNFKKSLTLYRDEHGNYERIYPIKYSETAGFCQSLVYTILYEKVFKMENVQSIVDQMLASPANTKVVNARVSSDITRIIESCQTPSSNRLRFDSTSTEMFSPPGLCNKALDPPFPYRVAKALSPYVYRNSEMDFWVAARREEKYGPYDRNGLQIGTKVRVYEDENKDLENLLYHGHIQKINRNRQFVEVFVEGKGERMIVPYNHLEKSSTPKSPQAPAILSKHRLDSPTVLQYHRLTKSAHGTDVLPNRDNKQNYELPQPLKLETPAKVATTEKTKSSTSPTKKLQFKTKFFNRQRTQSENLIDSKFYPKKAVPVIENNERPISSVIPIPRSAKRRNGFSFSYQNHFEASGSSFDQCKVAFGKDDPNSLSCDKRTNVTVFNSNLPTSSDQNSTVPTSHEHQTNAFPAPPPEGVVQQNNFSSAPIDFTPLTPVSPFENQVHPFSPTFFPFSPTRTYNNPTPVGSFQYPTPPTPTYQLYSSDSISNSQQLPLNVFQFPLTNLPLTFSPVQQGYLPPPPTPVENIPNFQSGPFANAQTGFPSIPAAQTFCPQELPMSPTVQTVIQQGFPISSPVQAFSPAGFPTSPPPQATCCHQGFPAGPLTQAACFNQGFPASPPIQAACCHQGFSLNFHTQAINSQGFLTSPPTQTVDPNGFHTSSPAQVVEPQVFVPVTQPFSPRHVVQASGQELSVSTYTMQNLPNMMSPPGMGAYFPSAGFHNPNQGLPRN